jgi:hypothetical protein
VGLAVMLIISRLLAGVLVQRLATGKQYFRRGNSGEQF